MSRYNPNLTPDFTCESTDDCATLLDKFAGQAMEAELGNHESIVPPDVDYVAARGYEIARAMLRARQSSLFAAKQEAKKHYV